MSYTYTCPDCQWSQTRPVVMPTRHICLDGSPVVHIPSNYVPGSIPKPEKPPSPPSLVKQAFNYSKAKVNHVIAGRPKCTDEQMAERFAVCQSNRCGLFIAKGDGLGQCAHASCGCTLKRLSEVGEDSKLRWADQQCPATDPATNERFWGKLLPARPGE